MRHQPDRDLGLKLLGEHKDQVVEQPPRIAGEKPKAQALPNQLKHAVPAGRVHPELRELEVQTLLRKATDERLSIFNPYKVQALQLIKALGSPTSSNNRRDA